MKLIKNLALTLILFLGFNANAQQVKVKHSRLSELPAKAQSFIKSHFSEYNIDEVKIISKRGFTEYEVELEGNYDDDDDIEIDFDEQGNWIKIDADDDLYIPDAVIPNKILNYIQKRFPRAKVEKIEKRRSGGYEVELSNDVEIIFDANENFVRFDD